MQPTLRQQPQLLPYSVQQAVTLFKILNAVFLKTSRVNFNWLLDLHSVFPLKVNLHLFLLWVHTTYGEQFKKSANFTYQDKSLMWNSAASGACSNQKYFQVNWEEKKLVEFVWKRTNISFIALLSFVWVCLCVYVCAGMLPLCVQVLQVLSYIIVTGPSHVSEEKHGFLAHKTEVTAVHNPYYLHWRVLRSTWSHFMCLNCVALLPVFYSVLTIDNPF